METERPGSALEVAVAHRLLLELEMLPFVPMQLTPDGRLWFDKDRLAAWLTPAVVELLEEERKGT